MLAGRLPQLLKVRAALFHATDNVHIDGASANRLPHIGISDKV